MSPKHLNRIGNVMVAVPAFGWPIIVSLLNILINNIPHF
jgi:hypothetical protein